MVLTRIALVGPNLADVDAWARLAELITDILLYGLLPRWDSHIHMRPAGASPFQPNGVGTSSERNASNHNRDTIAGSTFTSIPAALHKHPRGTCGIGGAGVTCPAGFEV